MKTANLPKGLRRTTIVYYTPGVDTEVNITISDASTNAPVSPSCRIVLPEDVVPPKVAADIVTMLSQCSPYYLHEENETGEKESRK